MLYWLLEVHTTYFYISQTNAISLFATRHMRTPKSKDRFRSIEIVFLAESSQLIGKLRRLTQKSAVKITFLEVEQAFSRAVWGESVRSIAQSLGVTEGCLRSHFRKETSPKEIRRVAVELFHARQAIERLDGPQRKAVDRLVAKGRVKNRH